MTNKPIKVLIADDDKDDADLLKEALEDALPSTNIVHVPDGIAALREIKTGLRPELVFLDLNMPLKNGLYCLKDIYNLELLPDTPIFIYSTSNNIKDINEAYRHDAAFYIIKPPSFKMLCEIIKRALAILEKPVPGRVDKAGFVLSETKLFI
jgi:CheY-like chemotaxis protein